MAGKSVIEWPHRSREAKTCCALGSYPTSTVSHRLWLLGDAREVRPVTIPIQPSTSPTLALSSQRTV